MKNTCEAYCSTKLSERLFNDGYHGDNVNGLHIPGDVRNMCNLWYRRTRRRLNPFTFLCRFQNICYFCGTNKTRCTSARRLTGKGWKLLALFVKTFGTFRENPWDFRSKPLTLLCWTLAGKSSERYWKPRIYVRGYASVRIGKYVHICRPHVHHFHKKIF